MDLKNVTPAIITIILIGLVLGIGMYVMMEFRDEVKTEYSGTDNEAPANSTAGYDTFTLSDASKNDYNLESVDSIVNASDGHAWTNYTYTSAGVITFGSDIYGADTEVNISSTYTYDAASSPEKVIGDTVDGLGDLAGWIAIIVVVLAAAIVLGIVLRSFGDTVDV